MNTDQAISTAAQEFSKIFNHLIDSFARLQVGRANPSLVENVSVEMYGVSQPLKALASITVPDPRCLVIQPWDRGALAAIEKGIVGVGLGLNPVNDGLVVRINIPPLTEERRAELTKHVKKLAEEGRIAIRNARQEAHNVFRELKTTSAITEDDWHDADDKLQAKVEEMNKKIDELAKKKEEEVMTV